MTIIPIITMMVAYFRVGTETIAILPTITVLDFGNDPNDRSPIFDIELIDDMDRLNRFVEGLSYEIVLSNRNNTRAIQAGSAIIFSDSTNDVMIDKEDCMILWSKLIRRQRLRPIRNNDELPSSQQRQSFLCRICSESPRTHVTVPCGHYVYCTRCVEEIMKKNGIENRTCVVCSKPYDYFLKVYS